jgi:hypothetical protein
MISVFVQQTICKNRLVWLVANALAATFDQLVVASFVVVDLQLVVEVVVEELVEFLELAVVVVVAAVQFAHMASSFFANRARRARCGVARACRLFSTKSNIQCYIDCVRACAIIDKLCDRTPANKTANLVRGVCFCRDAQQTAA